MTPADDLVKRFAPRGGSARADGFSRAQALIAALGGVEGDGRRAQDGPTRTDRGRSSRARVILLEGWGRHETDVTPQTIADTLSTELIRVDLTRLESEYIGETEKNLDRIFEAAERSGAILFFDEADALFGKRTEVRDSHDRYANVETSYLLQRIESHRGLVILTTNAPQSIDPALLERIDVSVQRTAARKPSDSEDG